jgi:hypothetical protein
MELAARESWVFIRTIQDLRPPSSQRISWTQTAWRKPVIPQTYLNEHQRAFFSLAAWRDSGDAPLTMPMTLLWQFITFWRVMTDRANVESMLSPCFRDSDPFVSYKCHVVESRTAGFGCLSRIWRGSVIPFFTGHYNFRVREIEVFEYSTIQFSHPKVLNLADYKVVFIITNGNWDEFWELAISRWSYSARNEDSDP